MVPSGYPTNCLWWPVGGGWPPGRFCSQAGGVPNTQSPRGAPDFSYLIGAIWSGYTNACQQAINLEVRPKPPSPPAAPIIDAETAARLRAVIGRLRRRLRTTPSAAAAGLTPTKISILFTVVRGRRRSASPSWRHPRGQPHDALSHRRAPGRRPACSSASATPRTDVPRWCSATAAGRALARADAPRADRRAQRRARPLPDAERQLLEHALPALEALAEQLKGRRP